MLLRNGCVTLAVALALTLNPVIPVDCSVAAGHDTQEGEPVITRNSY